MINSALAESNFIDAMHSENIGIGISYEAMHLTTLFRQKSHREGEYPNAERIARETVTLPLHAGLTLNNIGRIASTTIRVISELMKPA
ncbi:MAG: hypothetical protein HC782_00830 [Gammaproteobacteria bacterium]|nr:hypothetical protein [Gammaproteobacteria bacterium]